MNQVFIEKVCFYVDNLSTFIEGELLGKNLHIYADPEISFRHPQVAGSIERILFFPGKGGQPARFNRWDFVEPLCLALPRDEHRASDTLYLLRRVVFVWHRGGSERYDHDLRAIVERCVFSVSDEGAARTRAGLELLRARAAFGDSSIEPDTSLQAFAAERIRVALGLVANNVPYFIDIDIAGILARGKFAFELKMGPDWVWKEWRFFAKRGEDKCARGRPGHNRASKQIFRLLLGMPDRALEGELVEYSVKSALTAQCNWQTVGDGLIVCQSQLVCDGDGNRMVSTLYDRPIQDESDKSFHTILLHIWSILATKHDDICEEMKDAFRGKLIRHRDYIAEFVDFMRVSVSSPKSGWSAATVEFFGEDSKIDITWMGRASELLGAEISLRSPKFQEIEINT